ncbi:olfactory receptor 7G2-like [Erethizon dorsatum]
MEAINQTAVSEFLLLGQTDDPELRPLIFSLFLGMYLVTILGNLFIILAVSSDSCLHTPMYFFLSSLSFTDICISTTRIPKMLMNIETQSQTITYRGCLTQVGFVLALAFLEYFLLAVMAYDCYVAICHPLRTAFGVYISAAVTDSPRKTTVASVMNSVIPQMLNVFIYSLRNRDMKGALRELIRRTTSLPRGFIHF